MDGPDEDIRLLERGLRSSVYVSKCGTVYRRYEDTGRWAIVTPHVDRKGAWKTTNNQNISRIIAEAWMGKPSCRTCVHVASGSDPHRLENLSWPSDVSLSRKTRPPLPKHLQTFVNFIMDEEPESVDAVASPPPPHPPSPPPTPPSTPPQLPHPPTPPPPLLPNSFLRPIVSLLATQTVYETTVFEEYAPSAGHLRDTNEWIFPQTRADCSCPKSIFNFEVELRSWICQTHRV